MNILLLVEGPSDCNSVRILCRKLLPERQARLKTVKVGRGNLANPPKALRHVKAALSFLREIDLALLFVDSECTPEETTREQYAPSRRAVQEANIVKRCELIVVTHALETWLLADEAALREVLGVNARIDVPADYQNVCRPKEIMKSIYKRNFGSKRRFRETVEDPLLAAACDSKSIHVASFQKLTSILASLTN